MEPVSQKIIIACVYCKSLYRVPPTLSGRPVTCKKCRRTFLASEAKINLSNPEDEGFLLYKIALNYGFITEKYLEVVLTEYARCKHHEETVSFENILISHGGLNQNNVDLLKDIRDNWDLRLAEKNFANEAVKQGFISSETARKALIRQARIFQKNRKICLLCDLLTESGDLKNGQCEQILKSRTTLSNRKPSKLNKNSFPSEDQSSEGANLRQSTSSLKKPTTPVESPHSPRQAEKVHAGEHAPAHAPLAQPPSATSGHTAPMEEATCETPGKPQTNTQPEPPEEEPEHKIKTAPSSTAEEPLVSPPDQTADTSTGIGKEPDHQPISSAADQDASSAAPDTDDMSHPPAPSPPPQDQEGSMPGLDGVQIIPVSGLELIIAPDFLTATLKVPEGIDPSTVPVKDISAALIEEEIVFGVSEESLIKGFLNSKIFREKPFKIAEGIPPKPGKKGTIKFYFDTDYLKIGSINESGNIDFKDRGEIPYVSEGTLLADIKPSIQGEDGKDIYGRDIPVQVIQDVYLKCENGTRLSEDNRQVFAAVSGQPKLGFGNRISVLSELTIQGDVGFETGHVEFEGNIVVSGTVQSDFIVKGANINANELTGATIIARGDVDIKNGISNSILSVEGNVSAKFIHNSTVSAYGNVVVGKEIIDSEMDISGICSVERGKVISSKISAKLGVEAQEIGTDMSKPCHLRIGVDDHIEKETDLIEDEILKQKTLLAEQDEYLKTLEKKEKETHKTITELAHIQDRSQIEQKELKQKIEELNKQGDKAGIDDIQKKIEELSQKARDADNSINESFDEQDRLLEEVKSAKEKIIEYKDCIFDLKKQKKDKVAWANNIKGVAYVKTSKRLVSGTIISGKNATKTIKETMRNTRVREIKAPESAEGWEIKIS